ncbi:hypothetical protein [Nocardioides sp.]|uniref:hypothetical protein n=1 Tax=Nocardioides sp. TaxID=35761 RepID=UPI0026126AB5|nr:hypothetical protein [Nocardioides sp.]
MTTFETIDKAAAPAFRAIELRAAGVPAQNIAAADAILATAVADATELAATGQPAYAQATLLNAGLHAERLLTAPEPHQHRAVA